MIDLNSTESLRYLDVQAQSCRKVLTGLGLAKKMNRSGQ